MRTWRTSDGAVLQSGGVLSGAGATFEELAADLARVKGGEPVRLVLLAPMGEKLDLGKDWLLDIWIAQAAFRMQATVTTDYKQGKGIPKWYRDALRQRARKGRIY